MPTTRPNIEQLPDGHRLWSMPGAHQDSHFFILDDSGSTPHTTDDGPLHLDTSRPLQLESAVDSHGKPIWESDLIAIPLIAANGEETRTPSNTRTVLQLAVRFGWAVTDGSSTYFVAKAGTAVTAQTVPATEGRQLTASEVAYREARGIPTA